MLFARKWTFSAEYHNYSGAKLFSGANFENFANHADMHFCKLCTLSQFDLILFRSNLPSVPCLNAISQIVDHFGHFGTMEKVAMPSEGVS